MLTVGELKETCEMIEREHGSDCGVCIQIRDYNGEMLAAGYAIDMVKNDSGTLYLSNYKFEDISREKHSPL